MCKDNRNGSFILKAALANLRNVFSFMRLHPASKMLVNRNCVLPLKKSAVKNIKLVIEQSGYWEHKYQVCCALKIRKIQKRLENIKTPMDLLWMESSFRK